MLNPARPWKERVPPPELVRELEHDLRLAPLTARLLALRGIHGSTDARSWLARRLGDLLPPEGMADLPVAAQLLADAINQRKRILIHGDYDVDGSTSASLLALFVRACSHHATVFIPHRRIDGYGLGEASLAAAVEHQAELLITVDCGIADHGWAARIEAESGCRVVITDHHLPQGELPRCSAVVNPNRGNCPYPDKHLAGVGVAWKLAWATAKILSGSVETDGKVTTHLRSALLDALALVAVGTVADCAQLMGENRILVHHGLAALARTSNHGLRALLNRTGLGEAIAAGDVGWKLGPLLNASGRVGSAMANIRLLTATDQATAETELDAIVEENEERKRITGILTSELLAEAATPAQQARITLVFAGEGWHPGVVGIVASRLTEQFAKAACVIAITDGVGKGSLRTVPGIHLGEAIDACRSHLLRGGGHAMAAGITIAPENVAGFRAAFEAHAVGRLGGVVAQPVTDHDGPAAMAELDGEFFAQLDAMAPFGTGNPEPVLRLSDIGFLGRPRLFGVNGDHLKGPVTDPGGGMRELVVWKAKAIAVPLSAPGGRFDLLVRPQASRWRGEIQPRLVYVDGRSRS
ncbi:single-stranded-DNA-specific exonuclease RecJ [Planctomycetota bacterium]|nr:single-stranded-DNA-specific exonuclease RecJ [Planctomycetota bacterium]